MRMYWGKKIIEWTGHPKDAFDIMLWLNNRYELDGRDPNGFAGVAWCFGRHDRAWQEREVFGKIRYMNAAGLERKFKIARYVKTFRMSMPLAHRSKIECRGIGSVRLSHGVSSISLPGLRILIPSIMARHAAFFRAHFVYSRMKEGLLKMRTSPRQLRSC
jgi:hypothetical protein